MDITDIVDNIDHHKGQTGLGGEDALYYQDENSYSNYITPNSNEKITPFAFSDYDYMGSTFYAVFVLGME